MKKKMFFTCSLVALALMMLTSCSSNSTKFPKYVAVQVDKGDSWSIVDENGEIVVDGEYDSKDAISFIFGDVYWVYSGGKFQLYSIKSPKKPLTNDEWDYATDMFDGRALVAKSNKPIQIIDEKGEVVTTLGKDIKTINRPAGVSNFAFMKTNGKYGWADKNGKIIKEGLASITLFSDGEIGAVALQNEESEKYTIYDAKGNETGKFAADRLVSAYDKYISIIRGEKAILLDMKGEVIFDTKKYDALYPLFNGYCAATKSDGKIALLDMKGEELIRAKYDGLFPAGDKLFYVNKDGKIGVVNDKDETIVDFDYSESYCVGNNFFMLDNKEWIVVGAGDGKRIGKNVFVKINQWTACNTTIYYSGAEEVETVAAEPDVVEEAVEVIEEDEFEPDSDEGYNYILSSRKLTNDDLRGLTKKELEIMRNSIYARYGYRFKRDDLFNYFSQFSWYTPTTSDMALLYGQMSSIEKYNVEFIKKHE